MWHRFSVVLAVVTATGLGGLGYVARSPQPAAAPSPLSVESNSQPDTVATTYVQRNKRPGSGRRGMRG